MTKFGTLMISCTLLLAFAATGAEAQTAREQKQENIRKMEQVRTQKARPTQKPRATSSRDKVSSTGYHHGQDQDEPTQERPNPLDAKAARGLDPVREPVRGQGAPTLR